MLGETYFFRKCKLINSFLRANENDVIKDRIKVSMDQCNHGKRTGTKCIDYTEHTYIHINDAEYCYLEAGEGPMDILIHGCPDNAYSWEHQIRFLLHAGCRVVAPFTRGYAPIKAKSNSYFDGATLATDIIGLVNGLNQGKPVFLVGQDGGAAISYGVLAAFPDKVSRAMIMAVPHPVEINRTLKRSPRHCIRSFHWFLFQLPWLPERLIRWSKWRFLSCLWRLWSPNFNKFQRISTMRSMWNRLLVQCYKTKVLRIRFHIIEQRSNQNIVTLAMYTSLRALTTKSKYQ